MDREKNRSVYVGYAPGRRGSVLLSAFDPTLTQHMFDLERQHVNIGLEVCMVGNIDMYPEYLPVLAKAASLEEFEKLILQHFGSKPKTIKEQLEYNADQYIKCKNGEPNGAKVIQVNSDTLGAVSEVEAGDLPTFDSIESLFVDLNDESDYGK